MKVGPQSAGADPGPACYGRGGTDATVTDADVMLGYLDPDRFLGGRMKGDRALAEKALRGLGDAARHGRPRHCDRRPQIIDTQMAVGLRLMLEAKGCDATAFVLVPFGGAGPVHAWRIAEVVGIPRLLVPSAPGIGCAMGLLETDVVHVYMQSAVSQIEQTDPAALEQMFAGAARACTRRHRARGLRRRRGADRARARHPLSAPGLRAPLECPPGALTADACSAAAGIRRAASRGLRHLGARRGGRDRQRPRAHGGAACPARGGARAMAVAAQRRRHRPGTRAGLLRDDGRLRAHPRVRPHRAPARDGARRVPRSSSSWTRPPLSAPAGPAPSTSSETSP